MRIRSSAALWLVASSASCTPITAHDPSSAIAVSGTPRYLAVDFSHLYVASSLGSTTAITRFDKEEWQPAPLAKRSYPIRQLCLNNDSVYWLLDRDPKGSPAVVVESTGKQPGGKVAAVLSSAQRVTSFAFDATHLYWTQAGDQNAPDEAQSAGLLRAMDPSSTPTNVVTRQRGEPMELVLSGRYAYWVNREADGTAAVMSWPKAGGEAKELLVLHPSETEGRVPSLAAADDGVYVLATRELVMVAGDGSSAKRIAKGIYAPQPEVVFDYRHLYLRTRDGLMRSQPDGRDLMPFASQAAGAFVADDQVVYWISGEAVQYREK